ncbi:MAG TPA: response regulator transcription factor [Bacteroidota bacterium]|nr:response regulator transcription factor [Bacteroidota bacterium]
MIRVLIRALTPLAASGLGRMVESDPEFAVTAGDDDGEQPDVVLAEADPESDLTNDVAGEAAAGGSPVVLLADDPAGEWIAEALASGASAVLPRSVTATELTAALRAASAGLIVIHRDASGMLAGMRGAANERESSGEALTPREITVLRTMGEGLSNKEIAARLGISEHTVKFHVAAILAKLGAASRTEAVMLGVRRGLLLV